MCPFWLFRQISEKVGKTSIIEVLITETFEEDVLPVLPVLVVPKEVTPESVHVSIVDTPGAPSQSSKVEEELGQADVVVLVYTVDSEESTERIPSYWLPKFRSMNLKVPVILVGNKIDKRGGISDPNAAAKMEAFIKPIMDDFREVDVCIECSAKTVSNISEVFYFAQKAVLYPTGPVYDVETQSLKPPASAALRRIFKICDKDGDGGLNDKELNDFQFTCFNVHLKPAELDGVKKVVKESRPTNGLNADGSLSAEGFIFLHTLFVQKGRLETTWIVLRKFGYNDEMRLSIGPSDELAVGKDQSVELSAKGKGFIEDLFSAHDKDKDGMLSPSDLKSFFGECPDGAFAHANEIRGRRLTEPCDEEGKPDHMTLNGFMARWAMFVMDCPQDAMLSLLYLGYQDPLPTALTVTKSRKRDRYARAVSRNVLNIALLGGEGGLKTDVIRGLVDMGAEGKDEAYVASAAEVESESEKKTLVMHYVPESDIDGGSLGLSNERLEKIDVVCLVFDAESEASYEKCRVLYEALQSRKPDIRIPVVFVAGVGPGTGSGVLDEADRFCEEQMIPVPVRVDVKEGEFGNLYEDLLGVGLYPQVACPDYYGREEEGSAMSTALKVAAGAVAVGVVAYGAKRLYDYYSSPRASS